MRLVAAVREHAWDDADAGSGDHAKDHGLQHAAWRLDWDAPLPQRAVAKKVIVHLEDRRSWCPVGSQAQFGKQITASGHDHSGEGVRVRRRGTTFGAALGELRAVIGVQLGMIAAHYKFELPEELAAILPAPDID